MAPAARTDDSGATAAASNGLSILDDLVREGLGRAADSDESVAVGRSDAGANPQVDWEVSGGEIVGNFSETIASNVDGASLKMSVEGEFLIQACPDADGNTAGEFFVAATVELDSTEPRMVSMSAYEMGASIDPHVNDDALTTDLQMSVHGLLGDAVSTPGTDGRVDTTGTHVSASADLSFAFGAKGAAGGASPAVSNTQTSSVGSASPEDEADFADTQRQLAEMVAQRIAQLAEDYWRDGNCVYVATDPAAHASLAPHGSRSIEATPFSRIDDKELEVGTIEGVMTGDGTFEPGGAQPVHTSFTYRAPGEPGAGAAVVFTVTSRRGVGRAEIELEVMDGWILDETYEEVRTTALKCDGLFGPWTLESVKSRVVVSLGLSPDGG